MSCGQCGGIPTVPGKTYEDILHWYMKIHYPQGVEYRLVDDEQEAQLIQTELEIQGISSNYGFDVEKREILMFEP